jgi:hypothetical protein
MNTMYELHLTDCDPSRAIPLIKALRAITGFGLKEAKDLYDQCRYGNPVFVASANNLDALGFVIQAPGTSDPVYTSHATLWLGSTSFSRTLRTAIKILQDAGGVVDVRINNHLAHRFQSLRTALDSLRELLPHDALSHMAEEISLLAAEQGVEELSRPVKTGNFPS